MKRKIFFRITAFMFVFAMFSSPIETLAHRVLDYEWNCVGCGGNCLDTVVITPGDAIQ